MSEKNKKKKKNITKVIARQKSLNTIMNKIIFNCNCNCNFNNYGNKIIFLIEI